MKKREVRAFMDSDVVVSAVISDTGAAALLIGGRSKVELVISNLSLMESGEVVKRLGLDETKLEQVVRGLEVVKLAKKDGGKAYVRDESDAHIVAGARQSKSRFLLTYNLRHYDAEKIKRDLDILVMSPGTFLQYLRSLGG